MVNIFCTLVVSTTNFDFSFKDVPNNLTMVNSSKIGEVVRKGRQRGQVANTNMIHLEGSFDEILEYLIKINNQILVQQLEYLDLNLNVEFVSQCNFEITTAQIYALANLNIPISLSCFEKV